MTQDAEATCAQHRRRSPSKASIDGLARLTACARKLSQVGKGRASSAKRGAVRGRSRLYADAMIGGRLSGHEGSRTADVRWLDEHERA